jgi:drug/metabolite transporter (DMT)-like permease
MAEAASEGEGREIDLTAYGFLALMILIGSSTAPAAKFAVRELPVGLLPLLRFGVAGLCVLPLVARRGVLGPMVRESGGRLLVTAALCVPINQTFFLNGAKLAPTSHVGVIYAACPLVVLLVASALGQERLVLSRLLGVLASVLGVLVIGLGSLWHGKDAGRLVFWGDLLTVGAVTSWGAYLTVSKPLITRYGALATLAATFLVGSVLDLPIAAASSDWAALTKGSATAWRALAYLSLVVTVVGLACQNFALRRLDSSQVATVGNAAPLLTVIWGIWLFAEELSVELFLGGVLTLGGILWTSLPERTPKPGALRLGQRSPIPLPSRGRTNTQAELS